MKSMNNLVRFAAVAASVIGGSEATISGLNMPTAITYAGGYGVNATVFIGEKAGVVKFANLSASQGTIVLDIQSQISSFGDNGLRGLEYYNDYLYVSYSVNNPLFNDTCTDSGAPNNRTNPEITGCPLTSRLSRFLADNSTGHIHGIEEVILEGNSNWCSQFTPASLGDIRIGPDGNLYVASAVGASDAVLDYGQLGGNPCAVAGAPDGWGGSFRSQTNGTLDGKITRFDLSKPTAAEIGLSATIVAKGLHDPWKTVFVNDKLWTIDVGSTTNAAEEVNGPVDIVNINANNTNQSQILNFGFPCYDGDAPMASFVALNASVCIQLTADKVISPFYFYRPSGGERASISALGYYSVNGRLYFGDYSLGTISSIDPASTSATRGVRVEQSGSIYPVAFIEIPGAGLLFVDVGRGVVDPVHVLNPSSGSAALSTSAMLIAGFLAVSASLLLQ